MSDEELEEILAIINNDESIVMKKVSQVAVSELKDCRHARLIDFYKEDIINACIVTQNSFAEWLRVR